MLQTMTLTEMLSNQPPILSIAGARHLIREKLLIDKRALVVVDDDLMAVISDLPKMLVYRLSRHVNERTGREIIPENVFVKAPSAELRPDQRDQDSLPPYELLDRILQLYIEEEKSVEEIAATGIDRAVAANVAGKVDRNEYKRKQAPPGLKVTGRAFGVGRRMPIAAKYH